MDIGDYVVCKPEERARFRKDLSYKIVDTVWDSHECGEPFYVMDGNDGKLYHMRCAIVDKYFESVIERFVDSVNDLQIIHKCGKPYGIRNAGGYLFFFVDIDKYSGQEERFKRELNEQNELAEYLLMCLKNKKTL